MNKIRSASRLAAGVTVAAAAVLVSVLFVFRTQDIPDAPAQTVTVSPSATQLPTDTTVPSSTALVSATIFEEPFSDNHNDWYSEPMQVSLANGRYSLSLDCPAASHASQCGKFIQIPFAFPASYRMQVAATLVHASEGGGVIVGFQLRKSDEGYYYLNYIVTKSSYRMSRITQTGEFSIVPDTPTESLSTALGETNVLGIEVDGAEFTPLVNGRQMAPIHDGTIRTPGDTYLVVLVERGHSAELEIDNLIVERIE